MHYSAGAVVRREGKYLLIDRKNPPFGWAGPAGHVDAGEGPEAAVRREVEEETGLKVTNLKLIFAEEVPGNECKRGIRTHMWYLYDCETEGEVRRSEREASAAEWVPEEAVQGRELEPVWRYWFWKLGLATRAQKITLCGSMNFHAEMERIASELEAAGHEAEVPLLRIEAEQEGRSRKMSIRAFLEENGGIDSFPPGHPIWNQKAEAIDDHFEKILWADAILVANYPKHGIDGYVGGNTLIEMALARFLHKRIYLLHPVSSALSYKEEIMGMKPVVLEGGPFPPEVSDMTVRWKN